MEFRFQRYIEAVVTLDWSQYLLRHSSDIS